MLGEDGRVNKDPAQMSDAQLAIAAAEAGASAVRARYGTAMARYAKSSTDFATDADRESERAILHLIRAARPADAVVGEEFGAHGAADASRRWLVDPLCGTLNFAAQTPLFSVNVALRVGDETTAAAMSDPTSAETFWTDGALVGLRRNGSDSPMTPSAASRLVDVNVDGPVDAVFLGPQLLAQPDFRAAFGPRVSSTTLAVAWVAAGRRAAYVTDGDLRDSVHFTAGLALCAAAGCAVTDLAGDRLHTGRGGIAAADASTHALLLGLVSTLRR
jgi:myo-inositol-1(or 4)-monophosphatase